MNFKTTYILFGVLLVLLAVFGVTQLAGLRNTGDKSASVLPSAQKAKVQARDIESVEIDRQRPKAEKLVFYKDDAGWHLKEPNVRVDSYPVERLIDQVLRARVDEKADVPDSLAAAGLD